MSVERLRKLGADFNEDSVKEVIAKKPGAHVEK